ncbi:hypothetical protein U14_05292 [Candidatus Moduliflexus flocculans]|uniref:AdoMet activation domain-containing protein n=1 Tax=Candidatus Moduliflexus flocculans TaxID=1499966 RepID=A0A081BRI4_9BACT|nr:hypothetical protein U14_05292 [Candidatus Moduliflexus flocculans]
MEILQNIPITIDRQVLFAQAHIRPESEDDRILSELIAAIEPGIRPKAIYQRAYIDGKDEQGVTIAGKRFTSAVLSVNLAQIERVFPFIATCGVEVEELTRPHTDLLHQYVLDLLKEQVLRAAIAHLLDCVRTRHAPGQIAIMNPGSLADWPLTEQRPLFALFGDVKRLIGVELTDSFLMSPVKSVSGIIFPTHASFENCQLCPREVCPNRRAPYNQTLAEEKYHLSM